MSGESNVRGLDRPATGVIWHVLMIEALLYSSQEVMSGASCFFRSLFFRCGYEHSTPKQRHRPHIGSSREHLR